jgi:hypothetical protein
VNTKRDGTPVAPSTFTRRRGAFHSALSHGVREQFSATNRLVYSDRKQKLETDVNLVLDQHQCRQAPHLMA